MLLLKEVTNGVEIMNVWYRFDHNDPTTWPPEGMDVPYVIAVDGGEWQRDLWTRFGDDLGHWYDYKSECVTHWMQIDPPMLVS